MNDLITAVLVYAALAAAATALAFAAGWRRNRVIEAAQAEVDALTDDEGETATGWTPAEIAVARRRAAEDGQAAHR